MASPGRLHLIDGTENALPPEIEAGNVEYKRQLTNLTPERYSRLVSQLKWRLSENPHATAVYELGVEDDGSLLGLPPAEMTQSIQTLQRMASEIGAHVNVARRINLPGGNDVSEVIVRRLPSTREFTETRVALIGATGAGKSTLLGVLTSGMLDNGRGRARESLLCHLHEKTSGRTARVCRDIIGFDSKDTLLNYAHANVTNWRHITEHAERVVAFFDLAGDERYLRTTVSGLSANRAHFACLVVNARQGITRTAHMHLSVVQSLGLPLFVVVTHCDTATSAVNIATIVATLAPFGKCIQVDSFDTMSSLAKPSASSTPSIIPIFPISSTSGRHLNLLMAYLKILAPPPSDIPPNDAPFEMQIQELFHPGEVGAVVAGTVLAGSVKQGDTVQVGPDSEGKWRSLCIFSIHRLHLPVGVARAGETVSIAFEAVDEPIAPRRGAFVIGGNVDASGLVASAATIVSDADEAMQALRAGAEIIVHQGSLCESTIATSIEPLDNGKISVTVRFRNCVYVRKAEPVLLRLPQAVVVHGHIIDEKQL